MDFRGLLDRFGLSKQGKALIFGLFHPLKSHLGAMHGGCGKAAQFLVARGAIITVRNCAPALLWADFEAKSYLFPWF